MIPRTEHTQLRLGDPRPVARSALAHRRWESRAEFERGGVAADWPWLVTTASPSVAAPLRAGGGECFGMGSHEP